jgi:hypothetical protein
MPLVSTFESVKQNRRGRTEVAQWVQREVGLDIQTRVERGLRRLEPFGMSATDARVRGHGSRGKRLKLSSPELEPSRL